MRRLSKFLALAIGVSLLTTGSVSAVSSSSSGHDALRERTAANCPARPVPPLYGKFDEVVAAARELLIRGSVTLQERTIKLTVKNSPIFAVVVLSGTGGTPFPGLKTLREMAAKKCGTEIMQASWAVKIGRPSTLLSTSARTVFLVKTKSGWRTY